MIHPTYITIDSCSEFRLNERCLMISRMLLIGYVTYSVIQMHAVF